MTTKDNLDLEIPAMDGSTRDGLAAENRALRDMLRRAALVLRPAVGTHGEPCDGAVACGVKQDGYAMLADIDKLLRGEQ